MLCLLILILSAQAVDAAPKANAQLPVSADAPQEAQHDNKVAQEEVPIVVRDVMRPSMQDQPI